MKTESLQPENALERILTLAANEPAHRPEFFKMLLVSTVYVLGDAGSGIGQINLEAGSTVKIQHWEKQDGTPVIPFFSSLEVLQKSIDAEQSYFTLPARSLFEMTLGKNLMLNPKSPYGKEFLQEEIQHLLAVGVGREPTSRVVQRETKVLLGQPANYPSTMVASLSKLLAKHSNVKRAFVLLMHDPSIDEKPHLVVGIEADGDVQRVMREAGNVAADTAPSGEPIDLVRVTRNEEGLSQYFLSQCKPFYEKKRSGGILKFFNKGNNGLQLFQRRSRWPSVYKCPQPARSGR